MITILFGGKRSCNLTSRGCCIDALFAVVLRANKDVRTDSHKRKVLLELGYIVNRSSYKV